MPKLYTKKGDNGITSLYDGNKKYKDDIRFDVLGNLDELSSNIGLLCAKILLLKESKIDTKFYDSETITFINNFLREIQVKLLDIGSNIAVLNPEKKEKNLPKITIKDVNKIESQIDECEKNNTKLTEFLLPGIYETDSQSHICRTISRRTERSMWKLVHREIGVVINENILKYMNRLSDFFFALARNLSMENDIKLNDIKILIEE